MGIGHMMFRDWVRIKEKQKRDRARAAAAAAKARTPEGQLAAVKKQIRALKAEEELPKARAELEELLHARRSAATLRPRPLISIEEALSELDAIPGLTAVKDQVKSVAATIVAARRRVAAGLPPPEKPMRHFVFTGPTCSGKRTTAWVLARIFYAFGLIQIPDVVEGLPASAAETSELVDSALGGVLFINDARRLLPEAVQTLLRRAEAHRDFFVLILAGCEKDMEALLSSYPRFAGLFVTQKFP